MCSTRAIYLLRRFNAQRVHALFNIVVGVGLNTRTRLPARTSDEIIAYFWLRFTLFIHLIDWITLNIREYKSNVNKQDTAKGRNNIVDVHPFYVLGPPTNLLNVNITKYSLSIIIMIDARILDCFERTGGQAQSRFTRLSMTQKWWRLLPGKSPSLDHTKKGFMRREKNYQRETRILGVC